MQFTDRAPVAVALVYQSQLLHEHLRAALDEFGAHVVYESATSGFDASALAGSGASVVVVNLDPAIDEEIAQIEELMFDNSRKVIFNDGEVTSKLGGWDLARWARHLAAKITGDTELLPARPAGAEAVPVRNMPQHALDSTLKPQALQPPVVTGEAEDRASKEITDALSSFNVKSADVTAQVQARDELQAALQDFGFFGEAAAPSVSVNDLAVEPAQSKVPLRAAEVAKVTVTNSPPIDELFADFDFSEPAPSMAMPHDDASAQAEADAFADIRFDFDEPAPSAHTDVPMGLDDFLQKQGANRQEVTVELPVPGAIPTLARKPAIDVDSLMSNLSLELSPLDDAVAEVAAAKPVAVSTTSSALASDFDDILNSLSLAPIDEENDQAAPAVANAPATITDRGPIAISGGFGGLSLELDPIESAHDATADFAALQAEDNPFADLEFGLDETAPSNTQTSAFSAAAQPVAAALTGGFSRVWVLGASIGGPDAVREFLSGIPRNTSTLFLLAQHMGADFLDLMVSQLAKATQLEVKMAASGSNARSGQVLVVPLAERMLLGSDGDVRIVPLDEATPYSPSIDQVLFDAADRFGARAGVIIFSGMAHDAIEGAKYLASKGGLVWVQDPATCVVSSMIDGAVDAGIVRYQGGPTDLARKFVAEFG